MMINGTVSITRPEKLSQKNIVGKSSTMNQASFINPIPIYLDV